MTERNPIVVVLATLVTCTVYAYYWLFVTTEELKAVTGREELSPIADLLLTVVTFGLWGIWATTRNAGIVHRELVARGVAHEDRSLLVLGLDLATFVSGFAWLASMALLQDDLNRLARRVGPAAGPYRSAASFA